MVLLRVTVRIGYSEIMLALVQVMHILLLLEKYGTTEDLFNVLLSKHIFSVYASFFLVSHSFSHILLVSRVFC